LKKNVLLTPEYELFICVQNDTAQSEEEWSTWWRQEVGPWIRNLTWFSMDRVADWVVHRERLLAHMPLEESWKSYLRNSGSMVEYVQLQLAYLEITQYEQLNGFRYDYVIRTRTDSIYAKPVDFHWLQWTEQDVADRMDRIRDELQLSHKDSSPPSVVTYFMSTLLSDEVIPNIERINASSLWNPTDSPPMTASALHAYLTKGRYILTLRKNNLYVVRRDLFYMIPSLATMYGQFRSPYSDNYWFNAEGQFRDACYFSCVTVFDYTTDFEEKSLEYANTWNEAHFFDLDFNLIHPHMLYCVVRK
jgi:hypothetical protein